ncbi:MAG TPA: hypothetical protein VGN85_10875 [Methyloceanibacter sp.]|nr:hypothetical protein [Methyloceanibacter sp.]
MEASALRHFYSGYVLAPYVFPFAATVAANKGDAIRFLLAWALFEALMVFGGYSALPVIGLGLGFIGALAVIALSSPPLHPLLGRGPCAMPGRTRSWSISPSSCRWQRRGRCC